jgi:hypothetical protein
MELKFGLEFKCKKMAYDTGDILYIGYHENANAPDAATDHWLVKFTYDGTDIVKQQLSQGDWTNRADYFI